MSSDDSTIDRTPASLARGLRHELVVAFVLVLAVKLAWLAFDHAPRLFLGDSADYLREALDAKARPDRSPLYPRLLAFVAALPGSFAPTLIAMQTAFGIVTALAAFAILRHGLALGSMPATIGAVLVASEPTQLFYERMVLAESAGTAAAFLALLVAVLAIRRASLPLALLVPPVALLAAALRMNLLPLALGLSVAVPIALRAAGPIGTRRAATFLFALIVETSLLHAAYRHAVTPAGEPPRYIATEGRMRLAVVTPLVTPELLERHGLSPRLLATTSPDPHEETFRESQLWAGEGLVAKIERAHPDRADATAGALALDAARAAPMRFLAMQTRTLLAYFDAARARARLADDAGRRRPDPALADFLAVRYGAGLVDAADDGATRTAFAASRWWATFALFGGLAVALVVVARATTPTARAVAVLIALVVSGLVASQWLFSMIVSFRYLHTLTAVVAMLLPATIARATARSEDVLPRARRVGTSMTSTAGDARR